MSAIMAALGSYLAGDVVVLLLQRFTGLSLGQAKTASSVLKIGRALRKKLERDPTVETRRELLLWLKTHDPNNKTKLGDGVVPSGDK